MQSLQHVATLALVVLAVGLYVRSRTAGLVAVWLTWLLAPFVRRVLLLTEPVGGNEPLALAPFLVTAAVVSLELSQVQLSRRARRLLILVACAYLIGLPNGLLVAPSAAMFALFAYITGVGCFVIGYREADRGLVLPSLLMAATPILAAYAFAQYFLPLPEWDHLWRETVDIITVGSPEEGRIRVWSTLNSPGTFAIVLCAAALAYIAYGRITPLRLVGALSVFTALALTYVRSAWVAFVVAILVMLVAGRGAAIRRIGIVVAVVALFGALAVGGSTGAALDARVDTFGTLDQDTSAQARLQTPQRLVPIAIQFPFGIGIGQAGEATRLAGRGFRHTDNGYLSLLSQLGPVGLLVIVSVIFVAAMSAWRNAWRSAAPTDVFVLGVLAFFVVALFAGDHFWGVGGMIFWYTSGLAIRRRELNERPAT